MVVYEDYGRGLVRAYSDTGHKIISDEDGTVYDEAVDPAEMNRTYTESEEMSDSWDPNANAAEILEILLGGIEL